MGNEASTQAGSKSSSKTAQRSKANLSQHQKLQEVKAAQAREFLKLYEGILSKELGELGVQVRVPEFAFATLAGSDPSSTKKQTEKISDAIVDAASEPIDGGAESNLLKEKSDTKQSTSTVDTAGKGCPTDTDVESERDSTQVSESVQGEKNFPEIEEDSTSTSATSKVESLRKKIALLQAELDAVEKKEAVSEVTSLEIPPNNGAYKSDLTNVTEVLQFEQCWWPFLSSWLKQAVILGCCCLPFQTLVLINLIGRVCELQWY